MGEDMSSLHKVIGIGMIGSLFGGVGGVVVASIIETPSYVDGYRMRQEAIRGREKKIFAYVEEQMDKKDVHSLCSMITEDL